MSSKLVAKRELKAIVEFTRKHGYMMQTKEASTIWTDYQPLTYFMCARWVSELRSLHVRTQIKGKPNAAARTVEVAMWWRLCKQSKEAKQELHSPVHVWS
jgi:hypothetical protein